MPRRRPERTSRQGRARSAEPAAAARQAEAIITFAGGVAHDFSNLVQVILGFTELLRAQLQDKPELLDSIQEIITATSRANALVTQLQLVGRRRAPEPAAVDVNDVIARSAESLQERLGSKVRLELRLGPGPSTVSLDPAQFDQLLQELCAYARHAMSEGGTLTLATTRVEGRGERGPARPGTYLRLSATDTGPGFDPALTHRLREPFFLKRQLRWGSGLEFAVVDAVVDSHEGFIDIETAPGRGTTFHLHFPCQPSPAVRPGRREELSCR